MIKRPEFWKRIPQKSESLNLTQNRPKNEAGGISNIGPSSPSAGNDNMQLHIHINTSPASVHVTSINLALTRCASANTRAMHVLIRAQNAKKRKNALRFTFTQKAIPLNTSKCYASCVKASAFFTRFYAFLRFSVNTTTTVSSLLHPTV